jgi:hypothetical protein
MEVRSGLEKSSSPWNSLGLADLANMQAADGRFDLAHETIRLANAAAATAYSREPVDLQYLERLVPPREPL